MQNVLTGRSCLYHDVFHVGLVDLWPWRILYVFVFWVWNLSARNMLETNLVIAKEFARLQARKLFNYLMYAERKSQRSWVAHLKVTQPKKTNQPGTCSNTLDGSQEQLGGYDLPRLGKITWATSKVNYSPKRLGNQEKYSLQWCACSVLSDFVTPRIVAWQAPLSMGLKARILKRVTISSSRGSSRPRDRSCILAGGFFTTAPPGKPQYASRGFYPGPFMALNLVFWILLSFLTIVRFREELVL